MVKPWLEYAGQSSTELIGCGKTHRADSILCALECAIEGKRGRLSPEEQVLLSLMALDREVQNGGFALFFRNSSREYAPVMVENLEAIGARATAGLTAQAITARRQPALLGELTERYLAANEIERKLWKYVLRHQERIQAPARKGIRPLSALVKINPMHEVRAALRNDGYRPRERARQTTARARQLAQALRIKASEREIEAAVVSFLFVEWGDHGEFARGEAILGQALEAVGSELDLIVMLLVEKLIEAGEAARADRWALAGLEHIDRRKEKPESYLLVNWSEICRKSADALPEALRYFRTHFTRTRRKRS